MIFLGKLSIILLSSDSARLRELLFAGEAKHQPSHLPSLQKTAHCILLAAAQRVKSSCKDITQKQFSS